MPATTVELPAASAEPVLVHATCLALAGIGVLLRGPSGSGKSDLALRLIDRPGFGLAASLIEARLVADDQVILSRTGDDLLASAPERLAGLLEIRGLGIVRVEPAGPTRLGLVVDLVAAARIERYPAAAGEARFLGCRVPLVSIDATAPSAAARVRAALYHLAGATPSP